MTEPRYTPKDSYMEARREWNDRFGSYIARARTWQTVAIAALVVATVSVAGNVIQGTQSKLVPYVVEIDRLGNATAVGQVGATSVANEKLIRYMLSGFINDTRSVVSDGAVLKKQFARVKVMADRPVQVYLSEYFKVTDPNGDTNPVAIARTSTVSVEIASMLPLTADSWQIDWNEERRGLDGHLESTSQWKAILSVKIQPPEDETVARLNPLGIYITQLSWSRVLTK